MSDYETKQARRNFSVGVFVLFGVCALVWLIFKFGDLPIAVSEINSFGIIVQFPTAKGIQKNAPVEFCGYQIGRVVDVMAPEPLVDRKTGMKYHQTRVRLYIDAVYSQIPSNVDVKLMTRSLGSSYIELVVDPDEPLTPLDPNRPETVYLVQGLPVLQGSTGMTSEFFPAESQEKLVELIDGVNAFIANANEVIGDPANKSNFKETLANLAEVSEKAKATLDEIKTMAATGTSTLQQADAKIGEVVTEVVDTSQSIRELATTGTSTLKNIDTETNKLVSALVDTSEQLSSAIGEFQSVMEKVNNGQGTAAKVLNDASMYESLLENSAQLQKLLEEARALIAEWKEKKIEVKLF